MVIETKLNGRPVWANCSLRGNFRNGDGEFEVVSAVYLDVSPETVEHVAPADMETVHALCTARIEAGDV